MKTIVRPRSIKLQSRRTDSVFVLEAFYELPTVFSLSNTISELANTEVREIYLIREPNIRIHLESIENEVIFLP